MASYGLVLPEVFPKGTGIVDIKQITTSTDDNGENVIQVELFNGKKVEFKIRNGSKGNTGEAAGFTTPTAEIDDNTGKPSVEVTASGKDTAKKFHFSFKNLKGNKGDTGAAAGFTTPTAEIDNNTGVPNVAVTATGDDTKKKFHFIFKNLKGDKGDTGDAAGFDVPTAEVDNAVGTPSVTVTATGDDTKKKFHFTFKNLKGDKGDRGDLTDSVLAVIQNATHDLQQAFKRELYEETKARISSDNAEELARTQAINQEVKARTNAIDAEAKARIEGDKSIADYGDPSGNRKIQVGYAGTSLLVGQVAHLAGYTHDGAKLKDVTEEAVRQLLGLTQKHIIDMIYPVNSVYLTLSEAEPEKFFPGTKWKRISEGRFLVGAGTGMDSNGVLHSFGTENEWGEYFHSMITYEMPSHSHKIKVCNDGNPDGKRDRSSGADCQYWNTQDNRTDVQYNTIPYTETAGDGKPHNNIPPSYGVYIWRRIK